MKSPHRNFASIHPDHRGKLGVVDLRELPFAPTRTFWVTAVDESIVRANHAHRECSQFLICAQGRVRFEIRRPDGAQQEEWLTAGDALHLEPHTWLKLWGFSRESLVMVFCDLPYDLGDYITDFEEFSRL